MKSAGKARNNGLYRHIRTSKEIIRNLLNDLFNYITLNRNVVFTVRLMPKGVLRFFFYIYDVIKIFFTIRITSDNRSSPKSIFPIIPPLSLHTGIVKCTVV